MFLYPLFVFVYSKQEFVNLLGNSPVVMFVGELCFPQYFFTLDAWFVEETFARESFRLFVPSSLSLSLSSQLSSEGQMVILFCAMSAFEFLSCLSGS